MSRSWLRLLVSAEPVLGSADFRQSPEHPFGFRGDGSGRFIGAAPVTEWSEKTQKNIRWSTPVGNSFSSPILTDKDVLVTAEPNLLFCIERATGKERWKVALTPALVSDEKLRKTIAEYEPPKDGSGMMWRPRR